MKTNTDQTEHAILTKEKLKAQKEHEKIYALQEKLKAKLEEKAEVELETTPQLKPFKFISIVNSLFANKLESGYTYIAKDEQGREHIREE